MLNSKNRIGITNFIITAIFFLFIFIAIFGEILVFRNYVDALPQDQKTQGFGVLVIVIYGCIVGGVLLISSMLTLTSAICAIKCTTVKKIKRYSTFGIVGKFLGAAGLLFYAVMMFILYPQGLFFKIAYILVAAVAIWFAVWDMVCCGRMKKIPLPTENL